MILWCMFSSFLASISSYCLCPLLIHFVLSSVLIMNLLNSLSRRSSDLFLLESITVGLAVFKEITLLLFVMVLCFCSIAKNSFPISMVLCVISSTTPRIDH